MEQEIGITELEKQVTSIQQQIEQTNQLLIDKLPNTGGLSIDYVNLLKRKDQLESELCSLERDIMCTKYDIKPGDVYRFNYSLGDSKQYISLVKQINKYWVDTIDFFIHNDSVYDESKININRSAQILFNHFRTRKVEKLSIEELKNILSQSIFKDWGLDSNDIE